MSSRGHTAIAALAAILAMLVGAGNAGAAIPGGFQGVVTDAETGLPLGGASVALNGAISPPPTATTDDRGNYLLFGLRGGTGILSAAGPAGYDRVDVSGIAVPSDSLVTQNLALHRDWATPAGGATATSNDESASDAGCGSAAAVDTDRSTGWSAAAGRAAGDPATLTVQLPETIDVSALVLQAGPACGHAAGAALAHYRVETSPDGSTWTTAADGTLQAAQNGTDVAVTLATGTAGVKFVRLAMLSAQDPGATTIDVRELAVHGVGPNVPPSGTLTIPTHQNVVNAAIRLEASFTDPDSTIVHYLWDFDGDGTWDQATLSPWVTHVWAGQGRYHVVVGARDFRGALGTASVDMYMIDPQLPVQPILQRRPLITFNEPDGIDLETRIACSSACKFTASFVVSKRIAHRLHLKHRTIRRWHKHTKAPGLGSWTLTLPHTTIVKLRHHHLRKVRVRVSAHAVDRQHRRGAGHRWVTFR